MGRSGLHPRLRLVYAFAKRAPVGKKWGWNEKYTRLILPYGTIDDRDTVEIVDSLSGQTMHVRLSKNTGEVSPNSIRKNLWLTCPDGVRRRVRVYESMFTKKQYRLLRWSIHMMENEGWTYKEVYEIIRHFWETQPGQTPLIVDTVRAWKINRLRLSRKGVQWP